MIPTEKQMIIVGKWIFGPDHISQITSHIVPHITYHHNNYIMIHKTHKIHKPHKIRAKQQKLLTQLIGKKKKKKKKSRFNKKKYERTY